MKFRWPKITKSRDERFYSMISTASAYLCALDDDHFTKMFGAFFVALSLVLWAHDVYGDHLHEQLEKLRKEKQT